MISDSDFEFLFSKLTDLTLFLARPVQDRNNILASIEPFLEPETDGLVARMIACLALPPAIQDDSDPNMVRWRIDRFGNSLPDFTKLDRYLAAIQKGNLLEIAQHRFDRLYKHEQKLAKIWPGYRYAPFKMAMHYSSLPNKECDRLTGDELPLACTVLSGALEAESWFYVYQKRDQLKHSLLQAVILRETAPEEVNLAPKSRSELADRVPQHQKLLEIYWQIERWENWEDDLLRIHKALSSENIAAAESV